MSGQRDEYGNEVADCVTAGFAPSMAGQTHPRDQWSYRCDCDEHCWPEIELHEVRPPTFEEWFPPPWEHAPQEAGWQVDDPGEVWIDLRDLYEMYAGAQIHQDEKALRPHDCMFELIGVAGPRLRLRVVHRPRIWETAETIS